MAEENFVDVKYVGPGGAAMDIADYRDSGDGRVATGDVVSVPEDLARRMVLFTDWVWDDGTELQDVITKNITEEELAAEKAAAEREVPEGAESPVAGLTANDEHSDVPYHEQARPALEEFLKEGGSTAFESPANKRIAEIAAQENSPEPEGGESREGEEEVNE
jgi:hypothetical protein